MSTNRLETRRTMRTKIEFLCRILPFNDMPDSIKQKRTPAELTRVPLRSHLEPGDLHQFRVYVRLVIIAVEQLGVRANGGSLNRYARM